MAAFLHFAKQPLNAARLSSRRSLVYWEEEARGFYERLDGRIPYIEIAAL